MANLLKKTSFSKGVQTRSHNGSLGKVLLPLNNVPRFHLKSRTSTSRKLGPSKQSELDDHWYYYNDSIYCLRIRNTFAAIKIPNIIKYDGE